MVKKLFHTIAITLICLSYYQGVYSKPVINEKRLICQIKGQNVFVVKDPKYNVFIPKSVLLGSAVYESSLYIQGKEIKARFDCRAEKENISFDKNNYIFVDPSSCAADLYRAVCGY